MKSVITLTLISCLIGPMTLLPASAETSVLSLEDCIRIVLENDVSILEARDDLQVIEEKVRETRRRLWPSLSMSAVDNSGLGDAGAYSQYDPSTGLSYIPGEGFQTAANLQWQVFDSGGRVSAVRAERKSLELKHLALQQVRRDLARMVIARYLSILELQAELDVRKEQITQASEALKIAQGRLDTGSGIAYEVLLEDAYKAQVEADLRATEFALNQAIRALLVAMRRDVTAQIELTPPESTVEDDTYNENELIETATKNRLEFSRYQAEIDTWKLQLKILQASRRPRVDFTMSYSQQGQDYETFRDGDIAWSAGLSLAFSLFPDTSVAASSNRNWINSGEFMQKSAIGLYLNDGSSTTSRETDIRITILKLERELSYLKDSIAAEVYQAFESYRSAGATLNAREKNLAAMEENERIQTKRYELGLNQYKDVVDARTDRVSARISLARAVYAMDHSRTDLEYVLGLLDYGE